MKTQWFFHFMALLSCTLLLLWAGCGGDEETMETEETGIIGETGVEPTGETGTDTTGQAIDFKPAITFARGGDIFVMDADGKNFRNLTNGQTQESTNPVWSPDGKQIAYNAVSGLEAFVYVMDIDGQNQRILVRGAAPTWSPDGKQIAYERGKEGEFLPPGDIYVIGVEGENGGNLTETPDIFESFPAWSPDGKQIAFVWSQKDFIKLVIGEGKSEIYVMDVDGKNPRNLTQHSSTNIEPAWSPDGKQIAFASNREGGGMNFDIFVMDADGKNPRRLTQDEMPEFSPAWSPDGTQIAFVIVRKGIVVMDADGQNLRQFTGGEAPDWSPIR